MRGTAFAAAALLVFLSCAGTAPGPGTSGAPRETPGELAREVSLHESEKNPRETRKAGLKYMREFPDGPETGKIALQTGSACIDLGFLTEARAILLPLAGEGAEGSTRAAALVMLSSIDRARGRHQEAAAGLLGAMSLETDAATADSARTALKALAPLLSAVQFEKLREEHRSSRGIDIILEGCMSYAAGAADSSYMEALRAEIAALDSLKTVPDMVSARILAPAGAAAGGADGSLAMRVGLLCPMSGRFARLGEAFLHGASLAVTEHRMKGGAGVDLVAGDTRADALEARSIARRMIRDEKVSALVGDILSSTTIAAAQVAQNDGVVLYSPVTSQTDIEDIGDFVFQAPSADETELHALARVACREMGLGRIAFLAADNLQSRMTESLFRRGVEYHGASLVVSEFYEEGSTDFRLCIERIRRSDPEALFIASDTEDLVLILPQLSYYEFGVQLLGTSAWNSMNLVRMAARDMAGAVFPADADPGGDRGAYNSAAAFTGATAGDANRFNVAGYAAVRRILGAMDSARASGAALRDEMKRDLKDRRHNYTEMLSGPGIRFNTVRGETVEEYLVLRAGS